MIALSGLNGFQFNNLRSASARKSFDRIFDSRDEFLDAVGRWVGASPSLIWFLRSISFDILAFASFVLRTCHGGVELLVFLLLSFFFAGSEGEADDEVRGCCSWGFFFLLLLPFALFLLLVALPVGLLGRLIASNSVRWKEDRTIVLCWAGDKRNAFVRHIDEKINSKNTEWSLI